MGIEQGPRDAVVAGCGCGVKDCAPVHGVGCVTTVIPHSGWIFNPFSAQFAGFSVHQSTAFFSAGTNCSEPPSSGAFPTHRRVSLSLHQHAPRRGYEHLPRTTNAPVHAFTRGVFCPGASAPGARHSHICFERSALHKRHLQLWQVLGPRTETHPISGRKDDVAMMVSGGPPESLLLP